MSVLPKPSIEFCLRAVAVAFKVPAPSIVHDPKRKSLFSARAAIAVILHDDLEMSYPEVASALSMGHHSSVVYRVNKAKKRIEMGDVDFADRLRWARNAINGERERLAIAMGISALGY